MRNFTAIFAVSLMLVGIGSMLTAPASESVLLDRCDYGCSPRAVLDVPVIAEVAIAPTCRGGQCTTCPFNTRSEGVDAAAAIAQSPQKHGAPESALLRNRPVANTARFVGSRARGIARAIVGINRRAARHAR